MGFTQDLLEGVAVKLASAPDAPFEWRPDGAYSSNKFGIFAYTAPLARDRASLILTVYGIADDYALSDSLVSVQLDFYGTRLQVVNAVDSAFNTLHGLWGGILGGVKVQSVVRTSAAVLGIDEAGNLRQTENYDLAVHRPSTNRQ